MQSSAIALPHQGTSLKACKSTCKRAVKLSVVCSSSPRPDSRNNGSAKPLPPNAALATDAPRSVVQQPGLPTGTETERSRSHETDYVVVGSGIGGEHCSAAVDVTSATQQSVCAVADQDPGIGAITAADVLLYVQVCAVELS